MFANWLLVSVSIGYISLLFLIAHLGGKYRNKLKTKQQAIIYALSLGVYCTSWGFLGTSAQAANNSYTYISVYLAPILLFVFAWPFIQRMIKTSLQLKITSIADLLSARFGKSQSLAVIITIVVLIGTMPYIALQLKAIIYSYQILQETQHLPIWKIGLIVSIILAVFTIIFGIRTIDITERHPGVMIAIAFESLVKLIAFLLVGLFVCFIIYDSPMDIWALSKDQLSIKQQFDFSNFVGMFGMLIIVMSAFLCLPRQFQVMFVEIKEQKTSAMARWLLPIYVLIFAFFAGPLGLAGHLNYGDSLPADAYVLFLPAFHGEVWLSLFSFLGAISAASSMVIVSTIALSTMLSNEIVFPLMFKFSHKQHHNFNHFQSQLLFIRKALVLFVIFLSYGLLLLSPPDTLSSLGEVAFGAIAQVGPALFVAFYWRKATLAGVLTGISSGFTIWVLFNLLPQLGLYQHPFVNSDLPKTTVVTLLGLLINIISLWLISLLTRQSIREQMQSKFFYKNRLHTQWNLPTQPKVDIVELEFLVARFIGQEKAKQCFKQFHRPYRNKHSKQFNETILLHAETTLARVLGSASAKLVTSFAISGQTMPFDQVAKLVEDNSTQQLEFSRTVLQSAIENVSEGISVIDSELKLVAWNKQYVDIFNYPSDIIYIGCPIGQLIYFNLSQQDYFIKDINQQVEKRIEFIKAGSRHNSEYKLKNGKNIHIEGNPIPGGGFVMIFSDITKYRQTEKVLKDENTDLESRVQFRTAELEQANKELAQANFELAQAKAKAVQAHIKKSQYLKACSHDLLQPLSAARLFSSSVSLNPKVSHDVREQINKIDNSLEIANSLLLDLNEISRIESGNIDPSIESISVEKLFIMLTSEFNALTDEYQIEFHCKTSKLFVASDITLLSRIIQNFLSNAFRYAHTNKSNKKNKVLLGCRRQGNELSIQVFDNGPGIPIEKQKQVFEQFTQLKSSHYMGPKGLGLGLNIAQSLANILDHKINLRSQAGHGCLFSINVPIIQSMLKDQQVQPTASMNLQGVGVLCVDNEQAILEGMSTLLRAWQCQVFTAINAQQAKEIYRKHEDEIDIFLVDYQLTEAKNEDLNLTMHKLRNDERNKENNDHQINGIELIKQLRSTSQYSLPAVLITATTDENLMALAKQNNISYLQKIIKPLALRALMSALLTKELAKNYANK
ncbi:PAS-domain containing protein [Colwellia sp. 4_MG-2023]|uniref:hybrid sensor histidine kinase/response regulator n=1 Tax=unclassified Colwellia TaxID=196834 RepID=UPI001C08A706|nr:MULTISPECIES: PAS-domain containing protein [unclassified Colwellia]MBU2926568.1 PAS-domain containing protein [Colwellia sp. C2M11]MDO6487527.1 PAS-domain containing protein [Colwellia sp. 6_MG-2023]MDO6507563.1 PAS-domain containing protein [Colwellia sp. 5_MG-2023]MDO6556398.1 PAS-domain containing protein [Colwellia sp. 4_MG-2023]MDO6652606.1 PAS-domain containing protein [Colwellia sp. 3_MG-2023]